MKYDRIKINHPRASSDAYTFTLRDRIYYVLRYKHSKYDYYLWSVQEDPQARASVGHGRTREEAVNLAIDEIYRRLTL